MSKTKDHISLYMFRNYFATLVIAFIAMMISLMQFYQCSIIEAMQRLFVFDLYTTLYFLLLWLLNYLIFEISKILYDIYQEKISIIACVVLFVMSIIVFFIPMLDIFQYDICFLFLLIMMRIVKQLWKRKRPETGLK